jgi:hypothetical protein
MKISDSQEHQASTYIVSFTDSQLQKCYESNLTDSSGSSAELCQVDALLATYDVFHIFEGPHSARVHETIAQLLSPRLRPGLRLWYQRIGAGRDPAANVLRDHLSQLAGEKLEETTEIPINPS